MRHPANPAEPLEVAPGRPGTFQETDAPVRSSDGAIEDVARLDGLLEIDARGVVRACDARAERLYGRPAAEIVGAPADRLAPPALREELNRALALAFRDPAMTGFSVRLHGQRGDGSTVPLEAVLIRHPGPDGVRYTAALRDRTAARLAALEAHRVEQRFAALLSATGTLIAQVRQDGTILHVTDSRTELLRVAAADAVGQRAVNVLHPMVVHRAMETMALVAATRLTHSVEVPVDAREGEVWFSVDISPAGDAPDERDVFVWLLRDVTERKRGELARELLSKAIRMSASEWRATFDALETAMMLVDERARIVRLNQACRVLVGRGYRELVGLPLSSLASTEPFRSAQLAVESVASGGPTGEFETMDDHGRTWMVLATPLKYPELQGDRVVVRMRDVTEFLAMQTALRHSEATSAIGRMVAGIAHEARNPLFGLTATLDAFEAQNPTLPAGFGPFQKVLRDAVGRLSKLMTGLLDLGRPQPLQRERVPLEQVIRSAVEACRPLAVARGVTLAVNGLAGIPDVYGCPLRLTQVFQNLIDNAVRFTPPGTEVRIELAPTGDGRGVWAAVRDHGPGVRPDELHRVFEPFFTRRRDGIGLGLSIVRRLVEEHAGRITMTNHPEGGAQAEVILPTAEAQA